MDGLELVLNKHSSDYPALVREALLQDSLSDGLSTRASISNGWCWLISKSQLFVWKLVEGAKPSSRTNQTYNLTLQRTGLPYSQESVVIYPRGTATLPGVLAVSGEGTIRHWPIVGEAHTDTVIDLSSEVVLSIVNLVNYTDGLTFFALATTTGTIYRLETEEGKGGVRYGCIGTLDNRSFASRLSSFVGRGASETSKHLLRVVVVQLPREDRQSEESDDEDHPGTGLVAISTTTVSLFDPFEKKCLWSVSVKQLITPLLAQKLKAANIRPDPPPSVWGLDVFPFRQGLLFLAGISGEASVVQLALGYLDLRNNVSSSPASFSSLFLIRNMVAQPYFRAGEESTFVGRVFLSLSATAAKLNSMTHTDGVIILHHSSVQAVHLPENLNEKSSPRLIRTLELPSNDPFIGYASMEEHTYIIRARAGIESVRLLPGGFMEETAEIAIESLEERLADGREESMEGRLLKKALLHFSHKRINQASSTLNELLSRKNVDVGRVIWGFVVELLDSTCSSSGSIAADLQNKRLIFQRLLLFLRSMNIMQQMCECEQLVVPPFCTSCEPRTMAVLLQEASERLDVALALVACHNKKERLLLEAAARRACDECEDIVTQGGADVVFLTKLSNLHLIFPCLVSSSSPLLETVNSEERLDVLSACAHLLNVVSQAIDKNRCSHSSISIPASATVWTHGRIATAFLDVADLVLKELEKGHNSLSLTSRTRLREMLTSLIKFGLTEQRGRAENNKLLRRLLDMGDAALALEMAERFKDFKLLVKITHANMEDGDRRERLETYKRRFADDNFELYLCNYYLRHNMTHYLLEQQGERVEAFMAEHDSIRWRRELQTHKYAQAANSLMQAAVHEERKLWNQKMYASLAYLSACCADEETAGEKQKMAAIKEHASNTLALTQHQERIPLRQLASMFPDMTHKPRPLTLDEIVEVNIFDTEDATERIEGLYRALMVLGDMIQREHDKRTRNGLIEKAKKIWKKTFDAGFYEMTRQEDIKNTAFGALLEKFVKSEDLSPPTKFHLFPCSDLIRRNANPQCKTVLDQHIETTRLLIPS